MADESQFSTSRPDSKRKFDDGPPPPPPQSYNSVAPPLDGIQLAKLKAQEIAAKLFSDAEAKRPKVDNGSSGDDYLQKPLGQVPSQVGMTQSTSFSPYGYGTSKKIEIPNGRVGVIIGKSGDTIKYLQQQSGAKIQVTRDMDSDPNSQTRPVELTGTAEQISRAEQLINEVLSEADVGGSGVVANRKFGGAQPGSEHYSTKIPNNKVGLIIGKGGETIKNMQASSGARIQVIPLHLPPGDPSTERTLHIDGTSEQIEAAKKLVNEIISSENRGRNPQMGGAYPQQGYRPPRPPASWGPPGPPPTMQQPGYGYMQPGAYPGAPPQYVSQPPYGGYQAQPPASGGYSTGWDQTSAQGNQQNTPGTGYDYYNQQQPPTSAPADNTGYNYGQQPPAYGSQGSYGDASYAQGQQQTYGQDYSGGYNAQAAQSGYSQPTSNPQAGYDQQSYGSVPAYGGSTTNATQDGSALTYGAPGGTAPAAPSQQAPPPAQPSPTQQGYPSQPPSTTATSYPPQGTAQPAYGMPPTSQPGYGQATSMAQPSYGQSPQSQKPPATQTAYGQPPASQAGYAAPSQPGYAQLPPSQAGYGQPYQQVPPYGGAPPSQTGYGQQQTYGDSYGSGGYSQPPSYGTDGSAAPAAPSGVIKTSPQS